MHKLTRIPAHAAGGFTLIELMVTLTVAAILLGIGAPAFNEFVRGQAVKTASFDLIATLTQARSEAIKRNASVAITPVLSDWKNGWTMKAGTFTLAKQGTLKNNVAVTTTATGITYGSDGRLVGTAGSSFEISAGSSTSCVQITLSGMPISKKGSC